MADRNATSIGKQWTKRLRNQKKDLEESNNNKTNVCGSGEITNEARDFLEESSTRLGSEAGDTCGTSGRYLTLAIGMMLCAGNPPHIHTVLRLRNEASQQAH